MRNAKVLVNGVGRAKLLEALVTDVRVFHADVLLVTLFGRKALDAVLLRTAHQLVRLHQVFGECAFVIEELGAIGALEPAIGRRRDRRDGRSRRRSFADLAQRILIDVAPLHERLPHVLERVGRVKLADYSHARAFILEHLEREKELRVSSDTHYMVHFWRETDHHGLYNCLFSHVFVLGTFWRVHQRHLQSLEQSTCTWGDFLDVCIHFYRAIRARDGSKSFDGCCKAIFRRFPGNGQTVKIPEHSRMMRIAFTHG